MGREINRVPLDFDWPIGQTWLAYEVHVHFPECPDCREDEYICPLCRHCSGYSSGYSTAAQTIQRGLRDNTIQWPDGLDQWDSYAALKVVAANSGLRDDDLTCPRCHGHGDLATPELRDWAETVPETPIPHGDGWQLWETVGDSPMSPVFATSDELVQWMTENPWMLSRGPSLVVSDRETAERFVAAGWAPSLMTFNDGKTVEVVDGVTAVTRS